MSISKLARAKQVIALFKKVIHKDSGNLYYSNNMQNFYELVALVVRNPFGAGYHPEGADNQKQMAWAAEIAEKAGLSSHQQNNFFGGVTQRQLITIALCIAESGTDNQV